MGSIVGIMKKLNGWAIDPDDANLSFHQPISGGGSNGDEIFIEGLALAKVVSIKSLEKNTSNIMGNGVGAEKIHIYDFSIITFQHKGVAI